MDSLAEGVGLYRLAGAKQWNDVMLRERWGYSICVSVS